MTTPYNPLPRFDLSKCDLGHTYPARPLADLAVGMRRDFGPLATTEAVVVEPRPVYGALMLYPISPRAYTLAQALGKKTLNLDDLERARELGLAVEIKTLYWRNLSTHATK
jgi:hypothetical protein